VTTDCKPATLNESRIEQRIIYISKQVLCYTQ